MSVLDTSFNLKAVQLKNRFVFSACEDNLATDTGLITDKLIRKYHIMARGGIGLIVSSHIAVHPLGRTKKYQLGIYSDNMIPGLKRLVNAVHRQEGKIVLQLGHAGLQTTSDVIGQMPTSPSGKNPLNEDSIQEAIRAFRLAAERAVESGADGVQLHAAHGYLIGQFLSPYFNQRVDSWGGLKENRFRFLKEIILAVREILPTQMVLLVKMNSHDYTPTEGITPPLAVHYAKLLADLDIDGLEVSCGTSFLSPWNMCRGSVPVPELLVKYDESRKSHVEAILKKMDGQFDLVSAYNLDAVKLIRPVLNNIPLFAVGGWRQVSHMEEAIAAGHTDLIAMCRPFIKEPHLVDKIISKNVKRATCISCNRCLAALANDMPVRCYMKGFPGSYKICSEGN